MDVVVAKVVRALAPSLAYSTRQMANSGTQVEIWGRNLKPADAQKTDVYVKFTNGSEAGMLGQTASNPQATHTELPPYLGHGLRGTRPSTLAGGWLRLGHLDYTPVEETSEYHIAVDRLGLDYTANSPRWPERQKVYEDDVLTVQVGDTVTWAGVHFDHPIVSVLGVGPTIQDKCQLAYKFPPRTRNVAEWGGGSNCSWTFNAPGIYYYSSDAYCQGANGYIGKIEVRPQGTVISYNSTRIIFNMSSPFHLVRSGPGPIFAELIVAGRSSGLPVQIGTVTAELTVLESTAHLAANAETLVINGANMPLECPGDPQEVRIEGLMLWVDYVMARCATTSLVLRLQPGKLWGAAGHRLRVTRYAYSGSINVAIATIVHAFEPQTSQPLHAHPTLDMSSHFIGVLSNQA
jgi:plastocyanin